MILWLNPVTGLSGDMLLAAMLDLGAPLEGVRAAVASTGLPGWELDATRVRSGGISATRVGVHVEDDAVSRPAGELLEMVRRARPAAAGAVAARAIEAIAKVEARLHGLAPDAALTVRLHELGGHDTVVDTVGVAAAMHLLDVTTVHCAPLVLGHGTVSTRHGRLPAPAPATLELLVEAGAGVVGADLDGETVTPTGAALLLASGARFGPLPAMSPSGVGYGAGTRTFAGRANVLQAVLGSGLGAASPRVLLETNVDDVTPETLGHLVGRAIAAGASDAWITPIVMKKTRPGHTVHVLVAPERAVELERLVLAETGSLGLRRTVVDRLALERSTATVQVSGHSIAVKRGPWGAKPEHDDVAAAAAALDLPLRTVARRALDELDGRDTDERG